MAAPTRNDEYLFFQNLIATWPVELTGSHAQTLAIPDSYKERLVKATLKSMREARMNTNWISPNIAYENAVVDFIGDVLNPERSGIFFESFLPFQERIAAMGVHNTLVQTVLKLTSPGVPDLYQGCELWDLSLVDPDNRRPVDYGLRQRLLAELRRRVGDGKQLAALARELIAAKEDGRVKLFVTTRALHCRREHPG